MQRIMGVVAIAATLLFHSLSAHAAACCTSAAAFGTGRLLMWESWATGFRSQLTHELGFFDNEGVYEQNQSNSFDQQLRLDAYALVGLSESSSIFVVIPWLFPSVGLSDGIHTGSNLSDIQIGYRHQIIDIGEYEELPSLALSGSLLLPTGSGIKDRSAPQNLTSRDLIAIMGGASFEKTWMPYFVQLNVGASLLFHGIQSRGPSFGTIGTSWQLAPAAGVELTDTWVLSVLGQWVYESPSKYRTQIGIASSWRFHPHFTLQANFGTDMLLNGFGSNWPGAFNCGIGLRYGYF